jgi:hypothetical protein
MATFKAAAAASTVSPKHSINAGQPVVVTSTYTMTAAPAANDVFEMVRVPAGATIINVTLTSTDIDTGGSPTIVLDVGDGGDTDRYIDGATIGQAGGITASLNVNTGFLNTFTAEDTIDVLVQAGPETGAAGTLKLAVTYITN